MTRWPHLPTVCVLLLLIGGGGRARAAGLLIFEQGTKSMGMASAFAAQANDPSTLFFNPGSISFFSEDEILIGVTAISVSSNFTADDPRPGDTRSADRDPVGAIPPHLFYVRPLSGRWSLGLGVYTPFGLASEWKNKGTFPGRFISTEFELRTVDISANLGYRVGYNLGFSLGLVSRFSEFDHRRHSPAEGDSTSTVELSTESDLGAGLGWNLGVFARPTPRLSLGFCYRSTLDVNHTGELRRIPGGPTRSVRSAVSYPDLAIIGVAFLPHPQWVVEVDYNWTGWKRFGGMRVEVPSEPDLSLQLMDGFTDSSAWRAGVQYTSTRGWQVRGGVVVDGSPQPDADLSPVFADADRLGLTVGAGFQLYDVSLMYLEFDERSTVGNRLGLDGTYSHEVWLFGVTMGLR